MSSPGTDLIMALLSETNCSFCSLQVILLSIINIFILFFAGGHMIEQFSTQTLGEFYINWTIIISIFLISFFALCTAKENIDLHELCCILCIHLFSSVQKKKSKMWILFYVDICNCL